MVVSHVDTPARHDLCWTPSEPLPDLSGFAALPQLESADASAIMCDAAAFPTTRSQRRHVLIVAHIEYNFTLELLLDHTHSLSSTQSDELSLLLTGKRKPWST